MENGVILLLSWLYSCVGGFAPVLGKKVFTADCSNLRVIDDPLGYTFGLCLTFTVVCNYIFLDFI